MSYQLRTNKLVVLLLLIGVIFPLKADSIDDNIIVLLGDRANVGQEIHYTKGNNSPEYGFQARAPKRRFMEGWDSSNYFEWLLNAPDKNGVTTHVRPGKYHIDILAEADGSIITFACIQNDHIHSTVQHSFINKGYNVNDLIDNWNKDSVTGLLEIPVGACKIKMTKTGSAIKFRSLELVHLDDLSLIQKEIESLRGDVSWIYQSSWNRPAEFNCKYGLKLQWGWHSVQGDGTKKYTSWNEQVNAFNVNDFAKDIERTGAEVVILQVSRSENGGEANYYYYPGPCAAIDAIIGDGSRTAGRDLIMDMAEAFAALDHPVKLMFYYHLGHDEMLDSPWWPKNWIHQDDKTQLFKNWCNIFRELGNRYKDKLAGIIFDDGIIYYPAPFHELAVAGKTGNPDRIIGYNPFNAGPRLTDFQDLYYGEGQSGISDKDDLFLNDYKGQQTGVFAMGPLWGLQYEGHFKFGTDSWSSDALHYTFKKSHSNSELLNIIKNALKRKHLLMLGPLLLEGGSFLSEAMEQMKWLNEHIGT